MRTEAASRLIRLPRVHGWLDRWLRRRMPAGSRRLRLNSRSTYVLPTRYGWLSALVLLTMLLGSMNFSNSLGFLLTFLLTGLFLMGMLHTFRNLVKIELSAAGSRPVFAGESAAFDLYLRTGHGLPAYAVAVGRHRKSYQLTGIPAGRERHIRLWLPARRRGRLKLGRIRLWTEFPLGLFQVWSWLEPDAGLIVYPTPAGRQPPVMGGPAKQGRRYSDTPGGEDYAGNRRYHPGDSPRQIDWKALARGHDTLTKQFSDTTSEQVWLDWEQLPQLDTERRLSQLCQWILDLHRQGVHYGLKLPGRRIRPDSGEWHKHHCLETLALFTY